MGKHAPGPCRHVSGEQERTALRVAGAHPCRVSGRRRPVARGSIRVCRQQHRGRRLQRGPRTEALSRDAAFSRYRRNLPRPAQLPPTLQPDWYADGERSRGIRHHPSHRRGRPSILSATPLNGPRSSRISPRSPKPSILCSFPPSKPSPAPYPSGSSHKRRPNHGARGRIKAWKSATRVAPF